MKPLFFCSLLFLAACGNSNTAADPQTDPSATQSNTAPSTAAAPGDGLVGEWEMAGSVSDRNNNKQIDEAERKDLKPAPFKDYMKLNSDSTGLFTVSKMQGRFTLTAQGSSDQKFLNWYDAANGRHRVGTVIAVSKEELHIKEPGGNGLFIWKRI